MKSCDCVDKVNAAFKEHNTKVWLPLWQLGVTRASVEVEKVDASKRGKPKVIFCAFCPFCGNRYQE